MSLAPSEVGATHYNVTDVKSWVTSVGAVMPEGSLMGTCFI